MRNPDEVLEALKKNSRKTGYKFENLYRNLYNVDFYLKAYAKIYAKEGNMTPGTDGNTIDGFSIETIQKVIESLKNESYQPKPSKRQYILKKNGDKRPLGIPSIYDKLVQEVIRTILEAVYEENFSNNSHGFRPNRSCHTALLQIKGNCTEVKWWVEGDILGFFDNINHEILMNLLRKRIKDEKFIRLIWKFLKAGYVENFIFFKTYLGTPQGGIISPILANIYLNELDQFVEQYILSFDKGIKRADNKQYKQISNNIHLKRRLLEEHPTEKVKEAERKIKEAKLAIAQYRITHPEIINLDSDKTVKALKSIMYKNKLFIRKPTKEERQEIIEKIKELAKERRKHKTYEQIDENYRRLKYVRYADDFLLGVIGSKEEAEEIKANIKTFLVKELKLELSEEKTLITHNSKEVRFLGYDIFVNQKEDLLRRRKFGDRKSLARTGIGSIKLSLPHDVLVKFMMKNGYIREDGKVWKAVHRPKFLHNDDLEIVQAYNAEFRGFYQYYKFAFDVKSKLTNAHYIFKQSFCKTLAGKYRTKVSKLMNKKIEGEYRYFRDGQWGSSWIQKNGVIKFVSLFHYDELKFCKKIFEDEPKIEFDSIKSTNYGGRNSLIGRLLAEKCEWCGDTVGPFQINHIRKLKDLKGKKAWEKLMISRRRTLVLCSHGSKNNCHLKLHNGRLD